MAEYASPYSPAIDMVVCATGSATRIRFLSRAATDAVVRAVDAGLCRLVPFKDHPTTLFDPRGWSKEPTGIELTEQGRAHYDCFVPQPRIAA